MKKSFMAMKNPGHCKVTFIKGHEISMRSEVIKFLTHEKNFHGHKQVRANNYVGFHGA